MQFVLKLAHAVVTLTSMVSSCFQERLVFLSLLHLKDCQLSPIQSKLRLIPEGVCNGLIWDVERCEQKATYGQGIQSITNTINTLQLTDMALPHSDWASWEKELSYPLRGNFLPLPPPNVHIHSIHT